MDQEEWNQICSEINDAMLQHVRPFVCPLSRETQDTVRLVGTGSLVDIEDRAAIITCEHVAIEAPLNFRYFDCESVFAYRSEWIKFREPIDTAWTTDPIAPTPSKDRIISSQSISVSHSIAHEQELLFFFGFARENSVFGFEQHTTNGTGYLTQQKKEANPEYNEIELLWPNGLESWSGNTTEEAQKVVKLSDPHGFSGALVWNTRFLETGGNLKTWRPNDARVTGLLKRFDDRNSVLIATPIECLRTVVPFSR